jgi:4'-phosphopantetheinyl transferase EntD
MSIANSLWFADLPRSLALMVGNGVGNGGGGGRLAVKLLDLDHLRAVLLHRDEAALCREWLHPLEQEKLSSLRHQKRHLEWLGGRICVKEALRCFMLHSRPQAPEVPAPHLQIIHAPSGRPLVCQGVVIGDMAIPHISISHSGKYAMAVAAADPCGVDIQENRETLGRVREQFCSQAEGRLLMDLLPGLDSFEHLALLWAAKESVKKAVLLESMPGFLELELTRIDCRHGSDHHGGLLFTFALAVEDQGKVGTLASLSSPFQALVCLDQGYGVALCLSCASPFPGFHHA